MNQDNNLNQDKSEQERENRRLLIKTYIERLSQGEDLDIVRKEFVENFENVDASEIVVAEQELIQSGVAIKDVQRLCDVHSALFHGMTTEEQMLNETIDVETPSIDDVSEEKTATELREIFGHPLQVFMDENDVLDIKIKSIREIANDSKDKLMEEIQDLRISLRAHYSKKGDLIYPLLS
ncbi:MAG: DUF438 domain-containing protein, partial [Clostridiales bacterium]|nr:DUF438 domain-containing protein [Clostridiales bacterium]